MSGMTFNGVKKDYVTVLRGRKRPPWAPVKRNILIVPGMPGGYLESTDVQPRPEDVPILIKAKNFADLQKVKEDLADWLITDEPAELIFDDEPDRVYYAIVDGSLDLDEMVRAGQGVINFICPDPYKYGTEKIATFSNAASFNVNGSAQTNPIIKVTLKKDTTFVAVSNGDKINLIGNPVKQEEIPFQAETPVLITTCDNLTGWTVPSTTSIEGSELMGTLKANGDFYSDDYGISHTSWHGPAMKTSLGQAVKDFRYDVGFVMEKTGDNQAGGIEVALLDANNKIVTKVAVTKHFGELNNLYTRAKAGSYDVINENEAIFQSSMAGIFRVIRKGNFWSAQLFYATNNGWQSRILHSWTDSNDLSIAPVTQVQARLIQRADFPVIRQQISDINVYKLNDPAAGQVPIVAKAGDIIEFNHKENIIRRNGYDISKEKAFVGEYFPLLSGENAIVSEPADSISNTEVRWRDKWR